MTGAIKQRKKGSITVETAVIMLVLMEIVFGLFSLTVKMEQKAFEEAEHYAEELRDLNRLLYKRAEKTEEIEKEALFRRGLYWRVTDSHYPAYYSKEPGEVLRFIYAFMR